MARHSFIAGLALLCLLSWSAHAASRSGDKTVIALFPFLLKGELDSAIVEKSFTELEHIRELAPNIETVSGQELSKRLKGDPSRLLTACGKNTACVASLGRRARADQCLMGRVTVRDAGGIRISLLLVDAKSGTINQKSVLEVGSADDAKSIVAKQLFNILGITETGDLVVLGSETAVKVDGNYVGVGSGPFEVSSGWHEVKAGKVTQGVMVLPGQTASIQLPLPKAAPPAANTDASAVAAPVNPTPAPETKPVSANTATAGSNQSGALLVPTTEESSPTRPNRVMTYIGLGLAGVGAVALGIGCFFGLNSQSLGSDITTQKFTQVAALDRQAQANHAADMANGFLLGGGFAAAAGLVLVVSDHVKHGASVQVSLGPAPAASVVIPW